MNNNKSFFDNKELSQIDREIREHLNRPTLAQQMRADSRKKEEASNRGLSFSKELHKYWYVYVFLCISALFTGTLGIYMGLSPTMVTETDGSKYIHFNTDVGHVLLALTYLVAFIGVTELAFGIAKWKYYTREENNRFQKWLMIVTMVLAGASIMGTGIAGGNVVASNISFLSEFVNISPVAQKYVVIAIPVLIVLYTVLFSAYALSSDMAATERLMSEQERQRELDNRTRMNAIEQIAAEKLQAAEIGAFQKLVEEGVISSAQAMAAIRAGRSLKQEELFQGRDLDGDGQVGHKRPVSLQYRPAPVPASDNGREKEKGNFQ